MKAYYFILFFAVNVLNAQNLVPNPSFEEYTGLQTWMGEGAIHFALPWFNTPIYPGGNAMTADYIHMEMPLTLYEDDTYEFQIHLVEMRM